MIKEKYITPLSYILIFSILILSFSIYLYNVFTPVTLVQPDYVEKVFKKDEVIQINIEISEENFTSLIENAAAEEYVPADITINDLTIKNVGIRAKGNSSLQQVISDDETDRFSFKINFSEYITDQNLYGLEKMVLNNMIGDPTYLKEYLSYEIMEFLDVNTPAYAFANIKINNEDWGLYLAIETLEEDFLERYYGKDFGNLYKPESDNLVGAGGAGKGGGENLNNVRGGNPPSNIEQNVAMNMNQNQQPESMQKNEDVMEINKNGDNTTPGNMPSNNRSNSQTALLYIDDNISSYPLIFDSVVTKGLTNADKYNYIKMVKALSTGEDIEKYVDVDEVLRYFAANTFLVNLDSYAGSMKHNYYLYEKDGVFQILPWDFNLSFGTFQMNSAESVINFPIDTPVTDTMENSPLISSLLSVDEYKEIYHSYLEKIVNEYINSGIYENTIDIMNNLIYEYVENDKTAFYTISEYELGVENLKIYGEDRAKSITLQLEGEQPSTEYGDLQTTLNLSSISSVNGSRNNGNRAFGEVDNANFNNITENDGNTDNENINNNLENQNLDNINGNGQTPGFNNTNNNGEAPNFNNMNANGDRPNMNFSRGMTPIGAQSNNTNVLESVKNLIPYLIILIIAIVFALFYKRKKY